MDTWIGLVIVVVILVAMSVGIGLKWLSGISRAQRFQAKRVGVRPKSAMQRPINQHDLKQ